MGSLASADHRRHAARTAIRGAGSSAEGNRGASWYVRLAQGCRALSGREERKLAFLTLRGQAWRLDIAGGPPKGKLLPPLSLPSTGSAWRLFAAISSAGPPADPSWCGVQAVGSRSYLRPEPGRPGSEGWLCHLTGSVCSLPGGSASSPAAWGGGACLRGSGGTAWALCAAQPGCPVDAYPGAPRVFSQI